MSHTHTHTRTHAHTHTHSVVNEASPVDRHIDAMERWYPAVVMETHIAARCIPVGTMATHPVPGAVWKRLAVRLVVPAAQRHVAAAVPPLALLAGVIAVTGVRHPERVSGPDAVVLDDELEVVAGALERGEALRRQQQEDLHHQVMRQHSQVRLWLQQLLQPLTHLQEVLRHRCAAARLRGVRAKTCTCNFPFLTPVSLSPPPIIWLAVRVRRVTYGRGAGLCGGRAGVWINNRKQRQKQQAGRRLGLCDTALHRQNSAPPNPPSLTWEEWGGVVRAQAGVSKRGLWAADWSLSSQQWWYRSWWCHW